MEVIEVKDTKQLLESEIKSELVKLSHLELGSEKHTAAVRSLAELYKLNIDETEKQKDDASKNAQLTEQAKDRYFRLGIEVAGLIFPMVFYGIWMRRGFRFEETGTFTSTTFKGLFNKFKPTRK